MVVLSATAVFVALPTIQADLGITDGQLPWVVNSYMLAVAGFMLLGGRAADIVGHTRVFLAGASVFSLASLLCGLAQTQQLLFASRALQGLGAAVMLPASLSILTVNFPEGPDRHRALASMTAVNAGMGSLSLLLGGLLTDALSWRFVFFLNVPVGVGVVAASAWKLAGPRWRPMRGRMSSVRHSSFLSRTVVVANTAMFVAAGLSATVTFHLSLYLQTVGELSALAAGIAFLPVTAALVAGSFAASRLAARLGERMSLVVSMALVAFGSGYLTRIGAPVGYLSEVLPAMVVMYLGIGSAMVIVTSLATTGVAAENTGLASGMVRLSQYTGISACLAAFSLLAVQVSELVSTADPRAAMMAGQRAAFAGAGSLALATSLLTLATLPKQRPSKPSTQHRD